MIFFIILLLEWQINGIVFNFEGFGSDMNIQIDKEVVVSS